MPRLSKWVRASVAGPRRQADHLQTRLDRRALPRAGILPPDEAEPAILAGGFRSRAVVVDPLALLAPVTRSSSTAAASISLRPPSSRLPQARRLRRLPPHDRDGKTAFDLLHAALPTELRRYGWHAVGRLDLDTTGMLLFSNDERVVRHVTLPETHLSKRYLATVSGAPTDERLEPLRQGILLHDGPARPALARVRGPNEVDLTITGRPPQWSPCSRRSGLRCAPCTGAIGARARLPEGPGGMLPASELRDGPRLDLAPHA